MTLKRRPPTQVTSARSRFAPKPSLLVALIEEIPPLATYVWMEHNLLSLGQSNFNDPTLESNKGIIVPNGTFGSQTEPSFISETIGLSFYLSLPSLSPPNPSSSLFFFWNSATNAITLLFLFVVSLDVSLAAAADPRVESERDPRFAEDTRPPGKL